MLLLPLRIYLDVVHKCEMLGSNCMIAPLDTIATINRMGNELGNDTIEIGASIGVCMEAGKLKFGDGKGAIKFVKEMV